MHFSSQFKIKILTLQIHNTGLQLLLGMDLLPGSINFSMPKMVLGPRVHSGYLNNEASFPMGKAAKA
jgi:hypothetical protein